MRLVVVAASVAAVADDDAAADGGSLTWSTSISRGSVSIESDELPEPRHWPGAACATATAVNLSNLVEVFRGCCRCGCTPTSSAASITAPRATVDIDLAVTDSLSGDDGEEAPWALPRLALP